MGYWWTWERCSYWHVGAVATFATVGVIADQQPRPVKKKKHVEPTTPSLPTAEARGSSSPLQHVLDDFPSALNKSKVLPTPSHLVQHFLVTEGRPVTTK